MTKFFLFHMHAKENILQSAANLFFNGVAQIAWTVLGQDQI